MVRRLAGKELPELVRIASQMLAECNGGEAADELARLVAQARGGGVAGEMRNLIFAADGHKPGFVLACVMIGDTGAPAATDRHDDRQHSRGATWRMTC